MVINTLNKIQRWDQREAKQEPGGHSDPKGLETDAIHQMTEHMEAMHADPSTAPDVRHGDNSETATDIMYHDNVKHTES